MLTHDLQIFLSRLLSLANTKPFACSQAGTWFRTALRAVSPRGAAFAFIPFQEVGISDVFTYAGIILFILFISYLIQRETIKSRSLSKDSARGLEHERDILERRIAERTRKLMASEAEHLKELQRTAQFGELSKGLFHDLMSPLSSISLYIDKLARSHQESTEAQTIVKNVVQVSHRMNSFMESVRKNIGSTSSPAEARSEVSEELGVVSDVLGYKARMAGVTLLFECPEPIHLPIHPVRLHQLLLNLVSNAIEACEENSGGGRSGGEHQVRVVAHQNSDEVTITVTNNGRPMSPENVARAFKEPFTTKKHGTGTGLMTVKSIVEDELGGKVSILSTAGAGTTFTITIPAGHD